MSILSRSSELKHPLRNSKKPSSDLMSNKGLSYVREKIRTPDLLVRSQTLYPAELTARVSYRTTVLYYHSFQGNARGNFKFLEKIWGQVKTMNLTRGVWQG